MHFKICKIGETKTLVFSFNIHAGMPSGPLTLSGFRFTRNLKTENRRYRRPRLLTVAEFIKHARGNYEHSKWRLNRAKIIERYREKPCFLHFTSSYSFRSRSNTLFWKELTDAKILNVYLYNLSSINSK